MSKKAIPEVAESIGVDGVGLGPTKSLRRLGFFPNLQKLTIFECNSPDAVIDGSDSNIFLNEVVISECPLGPSLFQSLVRRKKLSKVHFAGGFGLPNNSHSGLQELLISGDVSEVVLQIADDDNSLKGLLNSIPANSLKTKVTVIDY